jgi:hypothetical protein
MDGHGRQKRRRKQLRLQKERKRTRSRPASISLCSGPRLIHNERKWFSISSCPSGAVVALAATAASERSSTTTTATTTMNYTTFGRHVCLRALHAGGTLSTGNSCV